MRRAEGLDRRAFLARVGRAGLVLPLAGPAGCSPSGREAETDTEGGSDAGGPAPLVLDDPTLHLLDGGAAGLTGQVGATPDHATTVAYVSRAEGRVYVDSEWRGRVHFLLGAYTSVSTGLWRIPLPGDPSTRPIAPGDEPREFEATDLADWDPARPPVAADMRVRTGSPYPARLSVDCLPVAGLHGGAAGRVSGGPWTVSRLDGPVGRGGREEYVRVGTGRRFGDAGCGADAGPVEVFGWVAAV